MQLVQFTFPKGRNTEKFHADIEQLAGGFTRVNSQGQWRGLFEEHWLYSVAVPDARTKLALVRLVGRTLKSAGETHGFFIFGNEAEVVSL